METPSGASRDLPAILTSSVDCASSSMFLPLSLGKHSANPLPMASSASLLGLPIEIVEEIVRLSDFSDICNLRLAAREAAAKASQASFKAHFAAKAMTLSSPDLESFVTCTQPGWLGCALDHLTIIGTPPAAGAAASESQEENIVALLATAFEQVVANSRSGRLRALSLTVSGTLDEPPGDNIYRGFVHKWRRIWQCAGDTARVAASALKLSGLKIEQLDAYGPVRRCALSSGRLQPLFDSFSQDQLTSLTVTVSTDESGYLANKKSDLGQNLKRILTRSKNLKHLDIRWFGIRDADVEDVESRDQRFFGELATLSVSSLSSLSLRGIRTASKELLSFLTRHPQLRHLRLEDLHLGERGQFDVVFAYIASHLELESLYLNDLYETRLIQFVGAPGKSYFPQPGPPTWMERAGPETKEKITYRPFKGRIKGSAPASNWRRRKTELYGPA